MLNFVNSTNLEKYSANCFLFSKLQKEFEISSLNDISDEKRVYILFRNHRDKENITEYLSPLKISFWKFQYSKFGYIEFSLACLMVFSILTHIYKFLFGKKIKKKSDFVFDDEPIENYFEILLKLPNGESNIRKFKKNDRILKIYEFLKVFHDIDHHVKLILKVPKIQISMNDSHLRLEEYEFDEKISIFISN
jgi:hypothetical protein